MGKIILTELQLARLMKNIVSEKADGISLRKLTFKSKWDFNPKHQGIGILDVFNEQPSSILWAYLNLEKISFVDEVLDKLQERYPTLKRIQKPGVDKEQYGEIMNQKNPFKDKTYQELKKIMMAKRLSGERPSKMLVNAFVKKRRDYKMDKGRSESPYANVERKFKTALRNQGHDVKLDPAISVEKPKNPDIIFPSKIEDKD